MALSATEISALVFRRIPRSGEAHFSLSTQMIDVLAALNGKRNLGDVARQTGYGVGVIKPVIAQLLNMKLIELVRTAPPAVDQEFMVCLAKELSLAIGPLAGVVIEDALRDLGHPKGALPQARAAELVDLLAREISRPEKRNQFQVRMVNQLKVKGYSL